MRSVFLAVTGVSLFLFGAKGWAAEGPVKTKYALDLEVEGEVDIGAVYRSEAFQYAYWGPCNTGLPAAYKEVGRDTPSSLVAKGRKMSPSIADTSGSMFIMDPQLSLGLKATLPKNVVVYSQLSTPFYGIGDEGGGTPSDFRKDKDDNIEFYRSLEDDRSLNVEQVYVEFRNLIVEDSGFDVRLGITDYALDFRGNGHPFLIDIQNSENPFMSPTGAAQYLIVDQYGNPKWDMTSSGDTRIDPGPFGRNTQEAAGILCRYATETGILTVDGYLFDIFESYERNNDDLVAGSTVTAYFDKDRELGKIAPTFLIMSNDSTASVYTTGAGVQFFPFRQRILELYGEAYWQFGKYANNVNVTGLDLNDDGDTADAADVPDTSISTVEQEQSYAFYAGARLGSPRPAEEAVTGAGEEEYSLAFFGGMQPYIDASYWEVSGDDEALGDRNENFISLENNNLSLIVESSYWGLDVDTNYRAARCQVGFYPIEGLEASAMYAYFGYQDNNGSVDNHVGSTHSKIGDELDFTLKYEYSTHVTFRLGTGFLFDPEALGTNHTLNLTMCQVSVDF